MKDYISAKVLNLSIFLTVINKISIFFIHFYTVYYAYIKSGFFAAVLTLIAPFISQIYWLISAWGGNNQIDIRFVGILVTYITYSIAAFLLSLLAAILASKNVQ